MRACRARPVSSGAVGPKAIDRTAREAEPAAGSPAALCLPGSPGPRSTCHQQARNAGRRRHGPCSRESSRRGRTKPPLRALPPVSTANPAESRKSNTVAADRPRAPINSAAGCRYAPTLKPRQRVKSCGWRRQAKRCRSGEHGRGESAAPPRLANGHWAFMLGRLPWARRASCGRCAGFTPEARWPSAS